MNLYAIFQFMDLGIKYQGKILRLMTLSWEDPRFLVPHMQTALLKKLQQYPTAWTDLPIVEKELALRAQKITRQESSKNSIQSASEIESNSEE